MEIWLSTLDRKNIFRFPYINDENVNFSAPLLTSEFENSAGKNLTLIGEEGLRTVKIKSFFPHKLYRWLPYNAFIAPLALKFINSNRKNILLLTIVSIEITIVMKCIIKDFEYTKKRNKDVDFSITLQEYIDK